MGINDSLTQKYLKAYNDMPNTKANYLAKTSDRMAGCAFDAFDLPEDINSPSSDDMMRIESSIFAALCKANGIDWRLL